MARLSVFLFVRSEEETARIDLLAEEIGTVQNLRSSFGPILNVVLMALDAPPVFMRTKALRALGQIVTSDSSILSTVCVQLNQPGACVLSKTGERTTSH